MNIHKKIREKRRTESNKSNAKLKVSFDEYSNMILSYFDPVTKKLLRQERVSSEMLKQARININSKLNIDE